VAAQGLTLVPIGVGTAYARPGEVQSCYLVRAGGAAVAVDLGAGTLNRLQDHLAPEELDALLITHMHPDHCADLLALRVYMAWGPGRGGRIRVIGPPALRDALVTFSGSEGWDALEFEAWADEGGELELAEGLTLRHAQVPHLDPTHAVRLEHGDRAFCFGADCADNESLPALAEGADLVLCECSFGAEPVPDGVPHLNGASAGGIAARAGAGRLLLTHCYPEYDRDAALAAAREAFGGPADWARQGEAVAA
jgi:ribonuclease BN (tRNA processing enzyme)